MDLLVQDLERQELSWVQLRRNSTVAVPGGADVVIPLPATTADGKNTAIALHGSFTPNTPPSSGLYTLRDRGDIPLVLIDELEVRRNLPHRDRKSRPGSS